MTQDLIRYDLLVQDALKGVVRKVLGDAARDGLPGEHHFYVSFRTDFPGVRLSTRMREKYPQDMTIVLQHQFWDLSVTEHALEVGLSFSGVPERLLIPFDALTGFFDPSVQFGLKFELQQPPALADSGDSDPGTDNAVATLRPTPAPVRSPRGAASEPDTAEPADDSAEMEQDDAAPKKATKSTSKSKPGKKTGEKAGAKSADKAGADAAGEIADSDDTTDKTPGAEVVSLDSFRKKN
ncbi:MAG: Stringent starvation protein B [Salinarimonas sp.]|nr:Stringent starvation protein B [Salinarimonas sp.]